MSSSSSRESSPEPTSPLDGWPKTPTSPSGLPYPQLSIDLGIPFSDTKNSDLDEEHTLVAFGDISLTDDTEVVEKECNSPTEILRPVTSIPRLRLKVKRPPMPKKRTSVQRSSPDGSPKSPRGIFDNPWSPPPATPLSPKTDFAVFMNALMSSPRSPSANTGSTASSPPPQDKQEPQDNRPVQIIDPPISHSPSRPPLPKLKIPPTPPPKVLPDHPQKRGEAPSSKSLDSPLKEVTNAIPAKVVAPAPPKPEKGFRRLPPRLPIPKWDEFESTTISVS
ncbi:hypothetical protein BJ138DRAFT_1162212 [Hygrophoropsis aurantiaca]|uniref:Uncharacterized protein n=1 Tax=Hygrophoropsis aurantiaca TaxID=72124 RepID=A0ACB8A1Q7_9AGAM|nr:hypothetical protein BJ138DRAFT_1162212 [Hygrophoropsis aurantiaca]